MALLPVVTQGIPGGLITEGDDCLFAPVKELPPVALPAERGEVPARQLVDVPHVVPEHPAVPHVQVLV